MEQHNANFQSNARLLWRAVWCSVMVSRYNIVVGDNTALYLICLTVWGCKCECLSTAKDINNCAIQIHT